MKIHFNTLTYQQTNFTGNSQKFRKNYSQKIENNTISETNIKNLQGLAGRFTAEGLTYEQCLRAAKSNLFMLVQKPETMEQNIRDSAKRFNSHGITLENYLNSALRYPMLFSTSPKTVEKNIKGHAKLFAYDGLSIKDLFKIAQSHPSIYTMNPKSLNKKVDKMAQKMGITRADIIEVFKKQPSIVSLNPKDLNNKFKLLKYIEQNKFFDAGKPIPPDIELNPVVLRKSLTNSMELNYLILLRNKISSNLQKGSKLPHDYLKKAIKEFIEQNSTKTIQLTMPNSEMLKEFTKYTKNFSKSVIGKNIFRFKIV